MARRDRISKFDLNFYMCYLIMFYRGYLFGWYIFIQKVVLVMTRFHFNLVEICLVALLLSLIIWCIIGFNFIKPSPFVPNDTLIHLLFFYIVFLFLCKIKCNLHIFCILAKLVTEFCMVYNSIVYFNGMPPYLSLCYKFNLSSKANLSSFS